MRRLWAEQSVTFRGRHFDLDGVRPGVRPHQPEGIPLWMAGAVPAAMRRLVRLAEGWLPLPSSVQIFEEQSAQLRAAANEAGKDPESVHRGVYLTLNINDDAVQAEREMRAFIDGYYFAPFDGIAPRMSLCFGTAETCIAYVDGFVAAGAKTIVVRFGSSDQFGQLARCSNDVLPYVRGGSAVV